MDDEKKLPEEGTVEDPKEEKKTSGDKNDKKESGYEEYCQMCRRPESVAGKMIQMPNDFCICNDCLQKVNVYMYKCIWCGNVTAYKIWGKCSEEKNISLKYWY